MTLLHAAEDDLILSNVWLNQVDRDTEVLVFEQDQQLYAECSVLKQLKVKVELMSRSGRKPEFCLLTAAGIKSELDSSLQAVKIELPGNYFEAQSLSESPLLMPDKASLGGFANYDLYFEDAQGSREYSALSEIGLFRDYWLLDHAMLARHVEGGEGKRSEMLRLNSTFSIDFPQNYTRLMLGDSTTVMNPFMNSLRFGGLSFGTSYTERPDFIYWNAPTLRGSAALPSKVDLLLNGVSIYQQQVTPGDYVLQTGASIQEAGNAQVVVEDVLGNRTVQTFPLMINNRLLLPELNEYNISLGKLRYNYNIENDDYREFFSNLYFRRGVSHAVTLGFNAAYSEEVQNLGLMWTQSAGKIAVLDMYAAGSRSAQEDGYSAGTALTRSWRKVSAGASIAYASHGYRILGYQDSLSVPKYDILAYLNVYDVPWVGSVNANYVQREYYDDAEGYSVDSKVLNLGISKSFSSSLNLGLTYFNDFAPEGDQGVYFSLNYNFDSSRSLYASHSTEDFSRLQFVQNNVAETGLDYTLGAYQRGGDVTYQAYGAYGTRFGDLTAQYLQSPDYDSSMLSYRGALVVLGKKAALTRYVDNAFALVQVGDYADVDIYRSLSPVGATRSDGTFFVHNIVPYVTYDISFNQDQLMIDDKIDYSSKRMIALDKRGYALKFPIYQTRLIVARLLDERGQILARASEVYLNQSQSEFFPVDGEGKVYLYGLKPDVYSVTVKTAGGKTCSAVLAVPAGNSEQSAAQPVDLLCK
ncbi:MAG: fimbria/pilus outer membrane usher protein [Acinetobacter sp.]